MWFNSTLQQGSEAAFISSDGISDCAEPYEEDHIPAMRHT